MTALSLMQPHIATFRSVIATSPSIVMRDVDDTHSPFSHRWNPFWWPWWSHSCRGGVHHTRLVSCLRPQWAHEVNEALKVRGNIGHYTDIPSPWQRMLAAITRIIKKMDNAWNCTQVTAWGQSSGHTNDLRLMNKTRLLKPGYFKVDKTERIYHQVCYFPFCSLNHVYDTKAFLVLLTITTSSSWWK